MDDIEVPQYFICPISLQIMKDPVTTASGITYDRESIEHWLSASNNTSTAYCPITKQPLPSGSILTPNHTLRRLIQAWCVANANRGVDRIPTPKSPLNKSHITKLIRNLKAPDLESRAKALKIMEAIASDEKNRTCMVEAGAMKAMILFVTEWFKAGGGERSSTNGVEEALKILHLVWTPLTEANQLVNENFDLIDALLWIIKVAHKELKIHAVIVMKLMMEVASSSLLMRLESDFFNEIVNLLRVVEMPATAIKAALQVLIAACPWGRNQIKIVEAGCVFELIELELNKPGGRMVTELVFCLLAQLCSCADGREQMVKHAGSLATVAKRILRVSPGTDDHAVHVLALVAKYSAGTNEVVMEMLRVGAVAKLCMVLQADCPKHLKAKASAVLRLHSGVWNNSPCIALYLLTKDPR